MNDSTNPLLEDWDTPPFARIRAEHALPALTHALQNAREAIARLEAVEQPGFDALVLPLERMEDRLQRVFSPVAHLNAVLSNPSWRAAHDHCLERLTVFHTELGQNPSLFRHFQRISESTEWGRLDDTRRKLVTDALRDFKLAGVHLPAEQQARCRAIRQRLSALGARFEANLLDATDQWSKLIRDEAELRGLPADLIAGARRRAQDAGKPGWKLVLDGPTFGAVMRHAANRSLRQEVYRAWMTRASDQGPAAPALDNGPTMEEMLSLRFELAQLLDFENYAELSLVTKMAPGVSRVFEFLEQLAASAKPKAQAELVELTRFARETDGLEQLESWDVNFYCERLKQQRFGLGNETLRPYFPLPQVLEGLFDVTRRLFGVRVEALDGADTWHEDVRYYQLLDDQDAPIAGFYLDPYARAAKRGGAWMDVCTSRARLGQLRHRPVAYLTLNAAPPQDERPALMTHEEVITLFHEFGHGLHHMLTQVDLPSLSGIAGVEWDAVELPSQLLENWCWERDALDGFARHVDTGAPLPPDLFQRLQGSRTFLSGLRLVRQLEFALFDFHLHAEYDPARGARIDEALHAARAKVAVVTAPPWSRFAHGFSHIFGGGYGAGYYSYLWAEVLSADAFEAFRDKGVFNPEVGQHLRREILARGGTRPAMDSFKAFRGREPEIEPLLALYGVG